MRVILSKIYILLITFFMYGCATTIQANYTMPAKHSEVVKYKSVAVINFETNRIKDYSLEFESIILNAENNSQKVYKVVDRNNIDKILKEHSFQVNIADQDTIVEMGKLLAIDAIWTGTISGHKDERVYYDTRTKCENNKCREYKVTCYNKSFSITAVPKLTSISTGEVIYSKSFTERASTDECVDNTATTPISVLERRAINKILNKFKEDISPYIVPIHIEVMDDSKGIEDENSKILFKDAIKLVKNGKIDRACQLWNNVYEKYKNIPSVAYNYSLCLEINGNYEEAIKILEKIISENIKLKSNQRNLIYNAIDRNEKNISNRNELEAQINR